MNRSSKTSLFFVLFCAAFLLHFVWEMWQIPFFVGMSEATHWSAVIQCTRATIGDGFIALFAYLITAITVRDLYWLYNIRLRSWTLYLAVGLVTTIILEHFATEVYGRWQYSESMPLIPIFGIGLAPFLQWLLVPPVTLWIAAVFLRGLIEPGRASRRT